MEKERVKNLKLKDFTPSFLALANVRRRREQITLLRIDNKVWKD